MADAGESKISEVAAPAPPRRTRKSRELPTLESAVVRVRRDPANRRLADYRLLQVSRLRWDYIGGGLQRRSQWHVYGFVKCDAMLSGKIAHSCRHGPPPHKVKVCITKKYNEDVWPLILAKVGAKPEPRRRRKGRRRKARANVIEMPGVPGSGVS